MVKNHEIKLVTSYVLDYENSKNSIAKKRKLIADFMDSYESFYVSEERTEDIEPIKSEIMKTGVKEKDANHIACAVVAKCDFFITTDDRLLKYKDERIQLVSPCEFIRLYKEENI